MTGIVSSIAPVFKALMPLFQTLLSSPPSPPQPQSPPPPPSPAPAPEAPKTESAAPDASSTPVLDSEAARLRAQRRRQQASADELLSLDSSSNSAVLIKSLLGE